MYFCSCFREISFIVILFSLWFINFPLPATVRAAVCTFLYVMGTSPPPSGEGGLVWGRLLQFQARDIEWTSIRIVVAINETSGVSDLIWRVYLSCPHRHQQICEYKSTLDNNGQVVHLLLAFLQHGRTLAQF